MSVSDFIIAAFVALIFIGGIYTLLRLRKISRTERAEMEARNAEKRRRKEEEK